MRLDDLLHFFGEASPAVGLLRSDNGPFVLSFFARHWKDAGRVEIPEGQLEEALRIFKEDLADSHPGRMTAPVREELTGWVKRGWLDRRYTDARLNEPTYQLSQAAEDVLAFVSRILGRDGELVGTGSRLHQVIEILSRLVADASDDPADRLKSLHAERSRLDEEIAAIEEGKPVEVSSPARQRETFAMAARMLGDLQGDFRAVEQSLERIAGEVATRRTQGDAVRGDVLGFALDAEEELRSRDEGESFYAFLRLILTPRQSDRLSEVIDEVTRLPELRGNQDALTAVGRMQSTLRAEAEVVQRRTRRLTTTLRRMLDERTSDERQRAAGLLREIQTLAAAAAESPPETVGLSVEAGAAIDSPSRRAWWTPPSSLESVELTVAEADAGQVAEQLREFAALARLDWSAMAEAIEEAAAAKDRRTLADVLAERPPECGGVEVLGYVQLAWEDGHDVDPSNTERIKLSPEDEVGETFQMTNPRVTLLPRDRRTPRVLTNEPGRTDDRGWDRPSVTAADLLKANRPARAAEAVH